jgi:hypothetical protein
MTVQEPHENPRTRQFPPAPEGFVPAEASDNELMAYGFPPRPDSDVHPELAEHWKQLMSRPMSAVPPQFAPMPGAVGEPPQAREATVGQGWAGSCVSPTAEGDTIAFVMGQWTVPHVVDPGARQDRNACATWIGIDKYPDILQAGTTQSVHRLDEPYGPGRSTFAWHQWWFREPPRPITTLTVSPGDTMFCMISVRSSVEADVFMLNATTDTYTAFPKKAPAGTSLVGDFAEWVLESPSDGSLGDLPKYGEVYFDWCVARTLGEPRHRALPGRPNPAGPPRSCFSAATARSWICIAAIS